MKKLLIIFLWILFAIQPAFSQPSYTLIVDAGSSGSRLHLFQYETKEAIPVINDIFSINVKPGLASFADQPEKAGESLKKLFDEVNRYLQKEGIDAHQVPLHILATAGMRLLPENKQKLIYTHVRKYLNAQYVFPVSEVKTITGKLEGLYGWLDVNYLMGNLQNNRDTVGIIEMGGASTQIAFATKSKTSNNAITLHIGSRYYTVFSESFLGLGQDEARHTMRADQMAASCYPSQYPYNKTDTGKFKASSCQAIYKSILEKAALTEKIPFMGNQFFVAYSGIFYAYHFFGVDKTPAQVALLNTIQTVCSTTWDKMQKNYPQISTTYLANYCADGLYHQQLIYNTYHVRDDQLVVTNQINHHDIDWTLGALLYRLS